MFRKQLNSNAVALRTQKVISLARLASYRIQFTVSLKDIAINCLTSERTDEVVCRFSDTDEIALEYLNCRETKTPDHGRTGV